MGMTHAELDLAIADLSVPPNRAGMKVNAAMLAPRVHPIRKESYDLALSLELVPKRAG